MALYYQHNYREFNLRVLNILSSMNFLENRGTHGFKKNQINNSPNLQMWKVKEVLSLVFAIGKIEKKNTHSIPFDAKFVGWRGIF